MERMDGSWKSGIMRAAWACGILWCGAAGALETAGDLLLDLDAARVTEVADGAALGVIPNAGAVGGSFVPRAGAAGAVYSADVAGRPAFTFTDTASIMTNTVLPDARVTGHAPWSVEAWVYNPALSTSHETYLSWTPRGGLADNARTVMECRYGVDSNVAAVEHYTTNGEWGGRVPLTGLWHHVCATYDADGVERVYVDGHLRTSKAIALRLATDGAFTLGGVWVREGGGYWGCAFSGALAKLRVHDGTLTSAQVWANYREEVGTSLNRWIGADGANWQDAANWSQGQVPANDAVIDAGGRVRVTQDAAVRSLQLPEGHLEVAGATLAVTGNADYIHCALGAVATLSVTGGGCIILATTATSSSARRTVREARPSGRTDGSSLGAT